MEEVYLLLGINAETAENLVTVYAGYASYLSNIEDERKRKEAIEDRSKSEEAIEDKSKREETELSIASCYLIAAIYQSLKDPRESLELFENAARAYRRMGNAYWKVLAICSLNENIRDEANIESTSAVSPDEIFADILFQRYFKKDMQERMEVNITDEILDHPVGHLQIPLRSYADAFVKLEGGFKGGNFLFPENRFNENQYVLNTWRELLNRANEPMRSLKADQYHWENLYGTFIPVEPEMIASCLVLYNSIGLNSRMLGLLEQELGRQNMAKIPLLIGKRFAELKPYGRDDDDRGQQVTAW